MLISAAEKKAEIRTRQTSAPNSTPNGIASKPGVDPMVSRNGF
jgi:hypothetical protein